MTEDEAKTKWCPYARSQTEDRPEAPAVNRTLQGQADIGCHCIGSACMAWRETHMVTDAPVEPRDGYCGLAGTP